MFHSDYIYEETKVTTDVNGLEFATTVKTEISKGWKELFTDIKKETIDRKKEAAQAFPVLTRGEKVLGCRKND